MFKKVERCSIRQIVHNRDPAGGGKGGGGGGDGNADVSGQEDVLVQGYMDCVQCLYMARGGDDAMAYAAETCPNPLRNALSFCCQYSFSGQAVMTWCWACVQSQTQGYV